MSLTNTVPAWLSELVREVGPVVVGEIVKAGADYLLTGHPIASPIDIGTARKVRDLIPDPLPNDAAIARADAEIARRQAMKAEDAANREMESKALDEDADTEPPPPVEG